MRSLRAALLRAGVDGASMRRQRGSCEPVTAVGAPTKNPARVAALVSHALIVRIHSLGTERSISNAFRSQFEHVRNAIRYSFWAARHPQPCRCQRSSQRTCGRACSLLSARRRGSSSRCRCARAHALQYVRLIHVDREKTRSAEALRRRRTLGGAAQRVRRSRLQSSLPALPELRREAGGEETGFTTRTSRGACRTRSPHCHSRAFCRATLAFPRIRSAVPKHALEEQTIELAGLAKLRIVDLDVRVA